MSNEIKKLLSIGDTVYSAKEGQAMTVTRIDDTGFDTDQDHFLFREVRKLYFLTYYGYWHSKQKQK